MSIITRDMPITGTAKYKTIIYFNPFIKKAALVINITSAAPWCQRLKRSLYSSAPSPTACWITSPKFHSTSSHDFKNREPIAKKQGLVGYRQRRNLFLLVFGCYRHCQRRLRTRPMFVHGAHPKGECSIRCVTEERLKHKVTFTGKTFWNGE